MATAAPKERTSVSHPASLNGGDARRADWRDPRYQAYALLRVGFTVLPIVFGTSSSTS